MLLVKTYLDKSKIHGIGLFAGEFIKKGRSIWKFTLNIDFYISKKEFDRLPKLSKAWVKHYGYYDKQSKKWTICVDDARFFNHSDNPNTDNITGKETIAKRNIKKGEELTCDYFEFDADARRKLKIKSLM